MCICICAGIPGMWFYKLFQPCAPTTPSYEDQCLNYLLVTTDLSQNSNIPSCPCNGQLAASDPRYYFSYVDWFRYCFTYNIPSALGGGIAFLQVRLLLTRALSVGI